MLRDFHVVDEQALHAFAGDQEVTRFTDWGPNRVEDSHAFVVNAVAQATDPVRSAFNLAVALADTGDVIGSVAVWVTSAVHRRGELGYVFHPQFWSQGYATEAASALLEFGFTGLLLHRIEATSDPDNVASIRVLEKAGMTMEGRLHDHVGMRGGWRDSLLFAALNPGV